MRPRGLQIDAPDELQGVDDAFGDVTLSFGGLSGLGGLGGSPLSLLSPNSAPLQRRASPARTAKAAGPAVAAAASTGTSAAAAAAAAASTYTTTAAVPTSLTLHPPEENDPLGELPQFRQRGGGTAARRRPDARRQSLAIGAMFAGLTQHAEGLLGDSELAVGDEEVQVPLAKSGKLLGGAANHSSLFVDPDTADLLATQLPSPQLLSPGPLGGAGAAFPADGQATPTPPPRHLAAAAAAAQQAAGGDQPAAEKPAECDSPHVAPALRALAASARKTPGGVRESVAVFGDLTRACESMGLADYDGDDFQLQESNKVKELAMLYKASATPRGSAPLSAQRTEQDSMRASADGGQPGSVQPPAAAVAGTQEEVQPQRPQQPHSAARLAQQQQQREVADRAAGPSQAAPAPARPAAAVKPAGSRLPAPPARTSRLRPPTTSSGYFSTASTSRVPALHMGSPARAAAAAGGADSLTPNTARLRYLEQNPELAFGGGTKLAASPAPGEGEAQPRKLTAEERHLMEWGDHL
ncbi:hypothetical protein C2E21_3299 [Chlorella sorokiniana]|uniref:Uncharacterized protein n=1 Tax=Chlorella sorokiniana TaxID=3076 RepID=A0A2P6TVE2_CHLSO|nr:hypothetical protein C2E21_3299 [Chlorella sorokiniana]|eukprot:PRW58043.1 hypothetical protein C2E21_3299 [Chlorella sorokiniana]